MTTSKDGLNVGQIHKFCKCFGLYNPRLKDGTWIADDEIEKGQFHEYQITSDNYWSAWHEGDLTKEINNHSLHKQCN